MKAPLRVTLKAKLLIAFATLLLGVTIALSWASLSIFEKDKRAQIAQTQQMQSFLTGKELAGSAKSILNSLRLTLASYNPLLGARSSEARRALEMEVGAILRNQSDAASFHLYEVTADWKSAELLADASTDRKKPVELSPSQVLKTAKILKAKNFGYLSLSAAGGTPVVAVALLERNPREGKPHRLAIGTWSLADLRGVRSSSRLTISSVDGEALFDDDVAQLGANTTKDELYSRAAESKVASETLRFEVSGRGDFLGTYTKPGLGLVVMSRIAVKDAMRPVTILARKFILVGGIVAGLILLLATLLADRLARPVKALSDATQRVAAGDFDIKIDTQRGSDEIGDLVTSFELMSRQIKDLIQERIQRVELENELKIASAVQKNFIPPEHLELNGVQVASRYQPAASCGGDWWTAFDQGDRTYFAIGDVTGHGVSSALLTAAASSAMDLLHELQDRNLLQITGPAMLLELMDSAVTRSGRGEITMSCFIGVLNRVSGELRFASAGHLPPWLMRAGESPESLLASGRRLGDPDEFETAEGFEEGTTQLRPGDMVLMYTDGLLEAVNVSGEQFGKKRAFRLAEEKASAGRKELVGTLVSTLDEFGAGARQADDYAIVAVEYLGTEGARRAA